MDKWINGPKPPTVYPSYIMDPVACTMQKEHRLYCAIGIACPCILSWQRLVNKFWKSR